MEFIFGPSYTVALRIDGPRRFRTLFVGRHLEFPCLYLSVLHGAGKTIVLASIKRNQLYLQALTYTLLLFASHFFTQSKGTRSRQVTTPEVVNGCR